MRFSWLRLGGLATLTMLGVSGCQCGPKGGADAGVQSDAGTGRGLGNAKVREAAHEAFINGASAIDLDGDGRKEWQLTHSADGGVLNEQIDLDGDGRPELVWERADGGVLFKRDDNGDGRFELTWSLSPDPDDGTLTHEVLTRDTNGDYVPDERTTSVVDSVTQEVAVTVEIDELQNGNWAQSTAFTTTVVQEATFNFSADPATDCAAVQDALRKSLEDGLEKGVNCLSKLDGALAWHLAAQLAARGATVDCPKIQPANKPNTCASSPSFFLGELLGSPIIIHVYPAAFGAECSNYSMDEILFHELLHHVLGRHVGGGRTDDGEVDPGDSVYACQRACFSAMPTNLDCAACLGTGANDKRCAGFKNVPCTQAPQYFQCGCTGKLYSQDFVCEAACPTGLGCFSTRCTLRGPCGKK